MSNKLAVVLLTVVSSTLFEILPLVAGNRANTFCMTALGVKLGSLVRMFPVIGACVVGSNSWVCGFLTSVSVQIPAVYKSHKEEKSPPRMASVGTLCSDEPPVRKRKPS